MNICSNTIKTDLLKDRFLLLYNESIIHGHVMSLFEYERKHNYAEYADYLLPENEYFNNNIIGMYIPRNNSKSKCTYIFNKHLTKDDHHANYYKLIKYNLDGNNYLKSKEFNYFFSMYNFVVCKLKERYGTELCKDFDINMFELTEEDIKIDEDWENNTTIAKLCYLMTLNLLIPEELLLENLSTYYQKNMFNHEIIEYVSSCFFVSEHLAYARLYQIINDYLIDGNKYNNELKDYISACIKAYKPKSNAI